MFTRLIKKNNLYKIIFGLAVVLIVLFSVFPRSVEVLNHNYLFLMDQGRDYMAVKDIVVNHKFTLIGSEIGGGAAGTQGVFQGPVYYYLLSLFFLIFKGDPYQYRINIPGTISPKNWSLRLPLSLEELLRHPVNQQIRKMVVDSGRV